MLRRSTLALMILVGLAAVAIVFINPQRYHRRDLKSCFDDVDGLQAGASVRIAGVVVGAVKSVRAEPQNKSCPAEVEMALSTTYEISVPKDSMAEVERDGLLGGPYISIDSTAASSAPVENYGYLKSKPRKPALSLGDELKALDLTIGLIRATSETKQSPGGSKSPDH
jgi:ABC-type transporter Mla subunit MlaD